MRERKGKKYQIEMSESTPYVELMFQATVPLACPGCGAMVRVRRHVGLTLSSCMVMFYAKDPPRSTHSLRLRAVQTAGSRARVVSVKFAALVSNQTSWDGYRVPNVYVSCFVDKLA